MASAPTDIKDASPSKTVELIEQITVDGPRVTVRPARSLRPFVPDDFEVTYDPAINLVELPPQIVMLPFLWNVAPVVWATDLEFFVDVLDPRVAHSFDMLRDELRVMYPSLGWRGSIRARSLVEAPQPEPSSFTMASLFSGGIDSTWTALRHSGKQLLLVSVWGSHVPMSDRRSWAQTKKKNRQFAAAHAGGLAVARSNPKSLNYPRLKSLTPEIPNWWVYVQHVMGFSGIAAPALYHHGIPILHVPSTWTSAFTAKSASLPRLDNLISLATAHVNHDSFEVSRQDKVQRIVAYVNEHDMQPPELRSCVDSVRSQGGNCERCQKCVRGIVAILVAGGDPTDYGFPRFKPETLDAIPQMFESFRFHFTRDHVWMWRDLLTYLPPPSELDGPFWSWLRAFDFERYRLAQPAPRFFTRRRVVAIGARAPRLYGLARTAKMLKRRLSPRR